MTFPDLSQPPGPAELASWLQADAVMMRDACVRVRNRWAFIQSLPEDAVPRELYRLFNVLATVADLYLGRVAQPEPYDFDHALGAARRGL